MKLEDLTSRANEILSLYTELSKNNNTKPWSRQDIVMGFVGDIGSLVKYAMAKEGLRQIPDLDNKLKHELADCLWSLLLIASLYDVDLEKAFLKTMDELEERFAVEVDR